MAWKRDFRRKKGFETSAAAEPDTAPKPMDESHCAVECPGFTAKKSFLGFNKAKEDRGS